MKVAALDLGSNTFLCLIADVSKNRIDRIIDDSAQVVRLGQDVNKTKILHPEALLRAEDCLKFFKKNIDFHQPQKILAMATSAARDANNKEKLFEIGQKLNIPIEIIPGDQEAKITFQGSLSGQSDNKKRLVIDIGGGSTEFIAGSLKQIEHSQSLDLGCVRMTEKFISSYPPQKIELQNLENTIQQAFIKIEKFQQSNIEEILAVAGTPTSLAAAQIGQFDPHRIDGFILTAAMLEDWKQKLQNSKLEAIVAMGIPSGRADVILVGVIILLQTLKAFKKNHVVVSTRGVRHGIALEMARRYCP